MLARACAILIAALALAAPAAAATTVLNVERKPGGGAILQRINPTSMQALSGKLEVKGVVSGFEVAPNRRQIVVGGKNRRLTFIKQKRFKRAGATVRIDADPLGLAWIAQPRLIVIGALGVSVVDTKARKVVAFPVEGRVADAVRVEDLEVVATLTDTAAILHVLDGTGAELRTVTLDALGTATDVDLSASEGEVYVATHGPEGGQVGVVDPASGEVSTATVEGFDPTVSDLFWLAADAGTSALVARPQGLSSEPAPVFLYDREANTVTASGIDDANPISYGSGWATFVPGAPGVVGHDVFGEQAWTALSGQSLVNRPFAAVTAVRGLVYATATNLRAYAIDKRTGAVRGSRRISLRSVETYGPALGPLNGGLRASFEQTEG